MIEFVEGVAAVGVTAVVLRGVVGLLARRTDKESLPDNVLSRQLYDRDGDFQCPECTYWILKNSGQVKPRCECDEYWEPHRHFVCLSCHFTAMIQTLRKKTK